VAGREAADPYLKGGLRVLFYDIRKILVHDNFGAVVINPYLVHAVVGYKNHVRLRLNKPREKPAGIPQVLSRR